MKLFSALYFLFMLIMPLISPAQGKYQGLLWEITGNKLTKPSYLYGTMHVSGRIAFHLTDTFFLALRNCDVVALEMNPENWMNDMLRSPEGPMYRSPSDYSGQYYDGFYKNAFRVYLPDKKDFAYMLAFEHSMTNGMLYRNTYGGEDYQEDTYLDLFIFQAGRKLGKEIASLEDFNEVTDLMKKANHANREEDAETARSRKKIMESGKSPSEMIEDAYRKGDLDQLDSLSRIMNASNGFVEFMIDRRNINMAERMHELMQTRSLFTGVGAAHLPGDKGVINLLREKGYRVRPVKSLPSKKSDKFKEKLEAMTVELPLSRQSCIDSSFSVLAPGPMHETPSFYKYRSYLFPDMINGTSYSMIRINTYGGFTGQSATHVLQRMDSLFFENIAGKTLEKKAITVNGHPGYDITHKTRRGDIFRQRIVVTPLEVLVFKMGGTGDFVAKSQAGKFFESIRIHNGDKNWKAFQPPAGGFSVHLPGNPVFGKYPASVGAITMEQHIQAYDATDHAQYLVIKSTLHDFDYIESDTFELSRLLMRFAERVKFETVQKETGSCFGMPCLKATLKANDRHLFVRIFLHGPHYYLLASVNTTGAEPKAFFDSFTITDYRYDSFTLREDTIMGFTVSSPTLLPDHPAQTSMRRKSGPEKDDNSHLPESKQITVTNYKTSETVKVKYYRFHRYYSSKSLEKFWDDRLSILTDEEKDLKVMYRETSRQDSLQILDFELRGKESAKTIRGRMISKGPHLFTLLACHDTLSRPGRFVTEFFKTFRLSDTLTGPSVIRVNAPLFLASMSAGDAVARKQALSSAHMIDFRKEDAKPLITLLDTATTLRSKVQDRVKIIRALGETRSARSIGYLEKLYRQASDTASLQLAILNALASQKSREGSTAIKRLLEFEAPLSSNNREIEECFAPILDTISLAIPLYPDLLEYTRYPEYKSSAYGMLSQLVDSGLVKPVSYEDQLAFIQREARDELKRLMAAGETGNDSYGYGREESNRNDSRKLLHDLSVLLIPFREDPRVSDFFLRVFRARDHELRADIALLLTRQSIPVPDTIWPTLARQDQLRVDLYRELEKLNKLELLDSISQTQEQMARGLLYDSSFDPQKDSVIFLGKQAVNENQLLGFLYVFKSKRSYQDEWRIDVAGPLPSDTTRVLTTVLVARRGVKTLEKGDDQHEHMEKAIEEALLYNRKRAVAGKDEPAYWEY